jgi:phosphoglycerate dehydrogenase-like enzyme
LELMRTVPDRAHIVIPGDHPAHIADSPHLSRLDPHRVTVFSDLPGGLDEQVERARDADIILNSRAQVAWKEDSLRRLPRLALIATCSIGVDNIDLVVARELGILVCNQPGRTAPIVAEHALALLMAVAKRAAFFTASMRAGRWERMDTVYLNGKTLGVIGAGDIGGAVARLGRALGMNVVAWTPHPSPERAQRLGVRFLALDELLALADAVSIHVKLTDQTRGLIGARELARMRPGALLVNTARGPVVDAAALKAALDSGHLGGAGLDVFAEEPLPAGDPLLSCQQVVLTPHCADTTPEGVDLLNGGAVDNILAFLRGEPRNVVS